MRKADAELFGGGRFGRGDVRLEFYRIGAGS
jgi:hypothetical protein